MPDGQPSSSMTAGAASTDSNADQQGDCSNCTPFSTSNKNERQPQRLRNWQLFPGKVNFYCDGRCQSSHQIGIFYFTVLIIVAGMGLFLGFDGVYLWTNVCPAIPIVAVGLLLFVLASLFKTAFSDPGILPRTGPIEAAEIERSVEPPPNPDNSNAPQYRPPPRIQEVVINGQSIKLKYCFTCKLFRPPRSSHCSVCDSCILNFDHHCPWVGNCIGKRNYRYFYSFVSSLAILCVYVFCSVITHLVLATNAMTNKSFIDVIRQSPGSPIVLLVCFFSVWSLVGLAGFHTYLLATNRTTNEDIKGTFSSKRPASNSGNTGGSNPYSSGFLGNCCSMLCSSQPPSLLNRRAYVDGDPSVVIHNPISARQLNGDNSRLVSPIARMDDLMPDLVASTGARAT